MEKKNQVIAYEVDNECECGGKMRPTGTCLTMNPPLFPHVCEKCGKGETYNVCYPYIQYK